MKSLEDRFWGRVDKTGDCWLWTAYIRHDGYGEFWVGGIKRRVLAHRYSYELARGTIPDGLQLDHLCRTRKCVNPAHLEAVTQRENLLRGETIPARNAAKKACPAGHEYTKENTYRFRNMRLCKICNRERKHKEV